MGHALYRKYRSKKLSEIVGQEHITATLQNALKNGSLSHAYLFTGPRGVGKTSIARILAHEINSFEYDESATHLDIIEIDAASNRRIDEIRQLREKVNNAPASGKFKVYIIDEVHMLTKEAFNALLKTLEEPPAHAVFILATTESHKLPETIISRTQKFTFRPIPQSKAIEHLRMIAASEKIKISDEALALIASHGDGSFRDSISLLDQVSSISKDITAEQVQSMLGIPPSEVISDLLNIVFSGNTADLIEHMHDLFVSGYQPTKIGKQLSEELRGMLTSNDKPVETNRILRLLRQLIELPASSDPETHLELALLELHLSTQDKEQQTPGKKTDSLPTQNGQSHPKVAQRTLKQKHQESKNTEKTLGPSQEATESKIAAAKPSTKMNDDNSAELQSENPKKENKEPSSTIDTETWGNVLKEVKKTHNTLYSIAKMGKAYFQEDALVLAFAFPFHQKRMNEAKNKQVLSDTLHTITGKNVEISCTVDESIKKEQEEKIVESSERNNVPLESISNIFGGAEVLES
jgi:DNA polymerase III subunit gamma/tau